MKQSAGAIYPYVRPHPAAVVVLAVMAVTLLVQSGRALAAWTMDVATPAQLLIWLAWTSALPVALLLRYALPSFLFGGQARITASTLTAGYWGMNMEYPWPDVSSVRVDGRNNVTWFRSVKLCIPLVDADMKCVKIELRRSSRLRLFVLWKDKAGTRIVGVPVPFMRSVRLFLREPEAFVEEAQRHLTSTPASPG